VLPARRIGKGGIKLRSKKSSVAGRRYGDVLHDSSDKSPPMPNLPFFGDKKYQEDVAYLAYHLWRWENRITHNLTCDIGLQIQRQNKFIEEHGFERFDEVVLYIQKEAGRLQM